MKLAVVGSRSITDYDAVEQAIWSTPWFESQGHWSPETWGYTLVSGGADGVDSLAEDFAEDLGIPIEVIEPDWDDWSEGHPAKVRNTKIVERADHILAVWDGQSPGTRDTIDKALDNEKDILVVVV